MLGRSPVKPSGNTAKVITRVNSGPTSSRNLSNIFALQGLHLMELTMIQKVCRILPCVQVFGVESFSGNRAVSPQGACRVLQDHSFNSSITARFTSANTGTVWRFLDIRIHTAVNHTETTLSFAWLSHSTARSDVLTAALLIILFLWEFTPRRVLNRYRRFEPSFYIQNVGYLLTNTAWLPRRLK